MYCRLACDTWRTNEEGRRVEQPWRAVAGLGESLCS